jgi:hypothetical protein
MDISPYRYYPFNGDIPIRDIFPKKEYIIFFGNSQIPGIIFILNESLPYGAMGLILVAAAAGWDWDPARETLPNGGGGRNGPFIRRQDPEIGRARESGAPFMRRRQDTFFWA